MKTRVLCCGTFDILHPGHLYFLRQASELGDKLYVVIARDENVNKIKGKYPFYKEIVRMKKVKELDYVDDVRLGYPGLNFLKVVKEINPDIIALGYDQKTPLGLREKISHSKIITLASHKPDKFKSSIYRNLKSKY